ncbi:hypothetical protein P3S67_007124 [Capsicum chacoense]
MLQCSNFSVNIFFFGDEKGEPSSKLCRRSSFGSRILSNDFVGYNSSTDLMASKTPQPELKKLTDYNNNNKPSGRASCTQSIPLPPEK